MLLGSCGFPVCWSAWLVFSILFLHRPDRQQRVAGKLDHVAAVRLDCVEDLAEGGVEQPAQLFDAGRAALGQAFGERGEAGDIGEQQRRAQRPA